MMVIVYTFMAGLLTGVTVGVLVAGLVGAGSKDKIKDDTDNQNE